MSINGRNQTLHRTYFLLSEWFRVPAMPSVFPPLPRAAVHGGAGRSPHRDACRGSRRRLGSGLLSAPQVAFTQSKEHLFLVRSKVQSCSSVPLFTDRPQPPTGGCESRSQGTSRGGRSCLCEEPPSEALWCFSSPYQCCELPLKIALLSLTPRLGQRRACLQSWMAKAKR